MHILIICLAYSREQTSHGEIGNQFRRESSFDLCYDHHSRYRLKHMTVLTGGMEQQGRGGQSQAQSFPRLEPRDRCDIFVSVFGESGGEGRGLCSPKTG